MCWHFSNVLLPNSVCHIHHSPPACTDAVFPFRHHTFSALSSLVSSESHARFQMAELVKFTHLAIFQLRRLFILLKKAAHMSGWFLVSFSRSLYPFLLPPPFSIHRPLYFSLSFLPSSPLFSYAEFCELVDISLMHARTASLPLSHSLHSSCSRGSNMHITAEWQYPSFR